MHDRPPRVIVTASPYGSLTHALECARLLAPLEHISIVVPARDAAYARVEIEWYDGIRMFVHVREQGTPDVLIPLAHIFAEDPLANVVIVPAEFCVAEPHVTAAAVRRALQREDRVSMIGLAELRSSLVVTGPITMFWDALQTHHPLHAAVFENYIEAIGSYDEGTILVAAYQHLGEIDFVCDVATKVGCIETYTLPMSATRTNVMAVISRARRRCRPTSTPPDRTLRSVPREGLALDRVCEDLTETARG